MTFDEMVQLAESGQEIASRALFLAGCTAIWYKNGDDQYQVRYDSTTGEVESVQLVGTTEILYSD